MIDDPKILLEYTELAIYIKGDERAEAYKAALKLTALISRTLSDEERCKASVDLVMEGGIND